jgi:hypothetical protein
MIAIRLRRKSHKIICFFLSIVFETQRSDGMALHYGPFMQLCRRPIADCMTDITAGLGSWGLGQPRTDVVYG